MKLCNRLLALGLVGGLILSGCGKNTEEEAAAGPASTSSSEIEVSKNMVKESDSLDDTESWNPEIIQRQLWQTKARCAVLFSWDMWMSPSGT